VPFLYQIVCFLRVQTLCLSISFILPFPDLPFVSCVFSVLFLFICRLVFLCFLCAGFISILQLTVYSYCCLSSLPSCWWLVYLYVYHIPIHVFSHSRKVKIFKLSEMKHCLGFGKIGGISRHEPNFFERARYRNLSP